MNARTILTILFLSAPMALAGCGGGGGSSSDGGSSGSLGTSQLSGVVADGALRQARVFLDVNGNLEADAGEPETTTGAGGRWQLDTGAIDGSQYAVVVEVTAGQTVDEDNPGQPVARDYFLATPPGRSAFASPLTTLVWAEMQKSPATTVQDAEVKVRFALGTGNELDLFDNYLDAEQAPANAAAATDSRKSHNAARLVAGMAGQLLQEIKTNLGSNFAATDRKVLHFILSDKILGEAQNIKTAVEQANAPLTPQQAENSASGLVAAIDVERLDETLVAHYAEHIAEGNPHWDATGPGVQARSPGDSQMAPVDTQVVITFDEELDPLTVGHGAVTLVGGGQTISGTVGYDAVQRRLTFTPGQALYSFTTYDVVLSSSLADMFGNSVASDAGWSFTTIFNELPPPPPDFS